jgi:hypothetical protein
VKFVIKYSKQIMTFMFVQNARKEAEIHYSSITLMMNQKVVDMNASNTRT